MEADAAVIASVCWQRGQGNFELASDLKASPKRPQSAACRANPCLMLFVG